MIVRRFPDSGALVTFACETFVETVNNAQRVHRRAGIGLAGGSTPRELYTRIARDLRTPIDWQHVDIFFGDERAVPGGDPESNVHMARDAWLDHVPIPLAQIHAMDGGAHDLDRAAAEYERVLRERLPEGSGGFPSLDLLWLGMGADGHTASLFPGTRALSETSAAVVPNEVPELETRRLTITFPVIAAAERVQVIVTGRAKAARLREVLAFARMELREIPADAPPAAKIRPRSGKLEWLVDAEAASLLETP